MRLPVTCGSFNAQPKAPAAFFGGPGQAGAFGWALNERTASSQPMLYLAAGQYCKHRPRDWPHGWLCHSNRLQFIAVSVARSEDLPIMPELLVENISKEFPTRAEPLEILRGVSLELEAGRNVAIIGPSGSGKSTLLNVLGALEPPTSGRVVLAGQDPAELNEPQLAAFRNRKIGFVFQDHHLLPQCSVLENVLVPTIAGGRTEPSAVDRAKMLIDRVGLADRVDHRPAELSGGQRQRVALARALILEPLLILADEPTGNLDRWTAERIAELLLDLQQDEGTMLIVVTHSPLLAQRMERQLELDEGVLVDSGEW
jgi:lipoprotein-releasing system ATP-binding protein